MWKVLAVLLAVLLMSSVVASANPVFAEPKKPREYVPDRLIVKFRNDLSISSQATDVTSDGASVISEISNLNVKILKVPEHKLEQVMAKLAKKYDVVYVEQDYRVEPAVIPNDPSYSSQWWLSNIKAGEAWEFSQGSSSIPIAILDSGVDPNHPDLADKLVLGYNFYNNNNDWSDSCGHGTSVAGTAAAITNNGVGVSGVAWNNPIIPIKITGPNCYGYYSSMIQGIVYATDNGAKAANISYRIFNGAALTDAAKYMHDNGGWVIASAGNTGSLENYSDNPYIISVGATTSSNSRASFSSYGPYLDFAAPGSSIYTTKKGSSYGYVSGTSFSSPIVAGLVGLIASQNPALNSQQIYEKIQNSAIDLGVSGRDNYYGWGKIDAEMALAEVTTQTPPVTPPIEDTEPPTVSITSPTDDEIVKRRVKISVTASDSSGIASVKIYIDEKLKKTLTDTPYSYKWNTKRVSSGSHTITAEAVDSNGNSAEHSLTVQIQESDKGKSDKGKSEKSKKGKGKK